MSDFWTGFVTGAALATVPWLLWLAYMLLPEIPPTTYDKPDPVAAPFSYQNTVTTTYKPVRSKRGKRKTKK